MTEAVTPPNPDQSDSGRHGNPPQAVPDPTLMTIDALRREIATIENLFSTKDNAREELNQERFRRIDALMERAEAMRQEQKMDTRSAVEAALDAQKEATHKMEKTVSEQIASLRENFETSIRGVHSSIADLKDRLTVQESVKIGQSEQKTESRAISANAMAIIGTIATVILVVLAVIAGLAIGT